MSQQEDRAALRPDDLRLTITADVLNQVDGAGSDLQVAEDTGDGVFVYVQGNLDVQALANTVATENDRLREALRRMRDARHVRWYCEVYESGRHNGCRCSEREPHRGGWRCGMRAYYDNGEVEAALAWEEATR